MEPSHFPSNDSLPALQALLHSSPAVLYSIELGEHGPRPLFLAPNLPNRLGWEVDEALKDPGWWWGCIHPKDRSRVQAGVARLREQRGWSLEYRFRAKEGTYHYVRDIALLQSHGGGEEDRVVGIWLDTSETAWAENRYLALLETLRRVDDLIVGTQDLDAVLSELLDLTLVSFGADRAWLLHPCDPDGDYWQVPMERTRPAWPGAFAQGRRIPVTPDMAANFAEVLEARGPVQYGPGTGREVPVTVVQQFRVKSRQVMAVRPRIGGPWLFGIHYCAAVHDFSEAETECFEALGERLGDALGTLLLVGRLHQGERRRRHLFEQAPVSLWEEDASQLKAYVDSLRERGVGDLRAYLDAHPEEVAACARRVQVLDVNRATLELYAAKDKQALLGNLDKTFNERSLQVFKEELIALAGGRGRFASEAQTRTLEGRTKEVMVQVALVPGHEEDWGRALVVINDIDARKRAEEEIRRLNRTLRLIGECSQALMRARSEQELLSSICREIVEGGGYCMAWVGFIDPADREKRVRPVAQAGFEDGYLQRVEVTWGDGPEGQGPTGTAIRTRSPVVCRDIHRDPEFALWREEAVRRGYVASVALPIIVAGGDPAAEVLGALNIYACLEGAFSGPELSLLREFTGELAYGLRVLRERAEQERTRRHLQALYDASPDMIFVHAPDGLLLDVNHNAVRCFGYPSREALLAAPPADLMGAGHDLEQARELLRRARFGEPCEFEWTARRRDGSELDVEVRLRALDDSGRVLAVVRDIGERKSLQARLARQAYYDELTGLPNRRLALERMRLVLSIAEREGVDSALMLLDLDNFKHINDTYGHDTGDRLLIGVAERLRTAVRATDTVARLGGDEFLVLMSELHDEGEVLNLADKILRLFDRALIVDGRNLVVSTSIGIARSPADGKDADTLLRAADSAMYKAKHEGRNTYCFFSPEINERMKRYLEVGAALHRAVSRDELQVHYQPVVGRDGRPKGMEALLRWPHPRWGWVSPEEFVPVAEDRGLIGPIGRRVLEQACGQLQCWRQAGLPIDWVSVNLSPRQLWERDLCDFVASVLASSGLKGECLKLEITEGLLIDHPPRVLATLEQFRSIGVRLALDDFGTGYSSLSYLKRYPFDSLKIDRSFVGELEHDPDDLSLTRTIIAMAKVLGLQVIAEGVETPGCARLLIEEGCDLLQGFLYSGALPAARVPAWVESATGSLCGTGTPC
jgi:diguanylate cyclase (GGDEF)-like protein/PAS domain S-box-containing protein